MTPWGSGGRNWWQALSPYLDEALDLPPEDRAGWLQALQQRNPDVAHWLETLLEAQERLNSEQFLAQPAAAVLGSEPAAGLVVGTYTLVSPIGEGGMGSVWLAERNDGRFERKVAVKFLTMEHSAATGLRRFEQEGRILGSLRHDHIAELLDAGVTASRRPYLVLEYVPGEPIDAYCERKRLDVDSRIRLFLDVLSAVAHAHANLIVHRDIKPSNVMIDSTGRVKLLDFGIAKLVQREESRGPEQWTRDGAAMTPLYAAPEQVTGGAITTAADVYALGLLLYLVLTGHHPAGKGPYTPADLMRTILEVDPPPLPAALSRDLDTIVAKALKKNPRERYASATDFAEDLRRYLNHEPIRARPDSLLYRTGKFVRRNRWGVIGISLASIALLAATAIAIRQAADARNRFDQVRRIARTFMFDFYDELEKTPGTTKARAMVISTAHDYLDHLADSAGGDRALQLELASSYERLALVEGGSSLDLNRRTAAVEHRKRALDIRKRLAADSSQVDPQILYLSVLVTDDLRNLRRLDDALRMGQESIAYAGKLRSGATSEILTDSANAHATLARVFRDLGRLTEAEAEMEKGDRIRTLAEKGKISRFTNLGLQDRANVLSRLGRLDEALQLLQRAEKNGERLIAEASPGSGFMRAFRSSLVTAASIALVYDDPAGPSLEQVRPALAYRDKHCKGWEHLLSLDTNLRGARAELAVCRTETALTLMRIDPHAAVAMARSGVTLFETLQRESPDDTNLRFRGARGATRLAMTLLGDRRPSEARQVIQPSLRTNRELLANSKDSPLHQHSLVWTLTVAGRIEHALHNDALARQLLTEAIGLAKPFHASLDLGMLQGAAEAHLAYGELLSGPERCLPLQQVQRLWQGYRGPSTPWLEARRQQTAHAVNSCVAEQQ